MAHTIKKTLFDHLTTPDRRFFQIEAQRRREAMRTRESRESADNRIMGGVRTDLAERVGAKVFVKIPSIHRACKTTLKRRF